MTIHNRLTFQRYPEGAVSDEKPVLVSTQGSFSVPKHASIPIRDGNILNIAQSYWDRIRAGRPMPSRSNFDPVDIPRLLPFTILIDVLGEPLDFRYRLLGTQIDRIVSRNYKGVKFSEIPHMERQGKLWSNHEEVWRTKAPLRSSVEYVGQDRYIKRLGHALFPLSSDGDSVDMIWCVADIGR